MGETPESYQRLRQIAEGLAEMLKHSPYYRATEYLDMYRDYSDKYRLMCGPDFVISLMDRLEEALKENEQLKDALKHYADADNWQGFEDGGHIEEQIVWLGVYGNEGTFPAGPDLAIVAISELKKEQESDGES